ncbi:MAG: hypothetical protein AAFV19_22590 [Pseudomonadota bacterium]
MQNALDILKTRVGDLRANRKVRLNEIDRDAGLRRGYASEILKGEVRARAVDLVASVARRCGLSCDDLIMPPAYSRGAPTEPPAYRVRSPSARPYAEDVQATLIEQDHVIDETHPHFAYMELFLKPDPDLLEPIPAVVGSRSFLAEEAGFFTPEQMQDVLNSSPAKHREAIAKSHLKTWEDGDEIADRKGTLFIPPNIYVTCSYIRLLSRVTYRGQDYILTYGRPYGRVEKRVSADHELTRRGTPAFVEGVPFEPPRQS